MNLEDAIPEDVKQINLSRIRRIMTELRKGDTLENFARVIVLIKSLQWDILKITSQWKFQKEDLYSME